MRRGVQRLLVFAVLAAAAGGATSMTITGVPNGRLLYFAVAAYDGAPAVIAAGVAASSPRRAIQRAGEFSPEASARPSRTADR